VGVINGIISQLQEREGGFYGFSKEQTVSNILLFFLFTPCAML
jgi:hypothetical protein